MGITCICEMYLGGEKRFIFEYLTVKLIAIVAISEVGAASNLVELIGKDF